MSRVLLLACALLLLSNCGIKRPLVPPKEIPAYEENLRKKRERLILDEQRAIEAEKATQ